jgi:hypothetical protein
MILGQSRGPTPNARHQIALRWVAPLAVLSAACLTIGAGASPTADEMQARRARVAAMDPAAQQELLRRYEQFQALPPEEQQRLRRLQADLDADPDSKRLRQVLERYHEWLKSITTAERATLAELSPKERVKEIERLQRHQIYAQRLEALEPGDLVEIHRWIDEMIDEHRQELEAGLSGRGREFYQRQSDPEAKKMVLVYRLFGRRGKDESLVTPQDIARLTSRLSDSAKATLAEAPTPEERRRVVGGWLFATLRRYSSWQGGRRANQVVGEELLQFLQNDVRPDKREELLKKPREEMLQELRRMYFEREQMRGPPGPPFDGRGERRGRPDDDERPRRGGSDDERRAGKPRPGKPNDEKRAG